MLVERHHSTARNSARATNFFSFLFGRGLDQRVGLRSARDLTFFSASFFALSPRGRWFDGVHHILAGGTRVKREGPAARGFFIARKRVSLPADRECVTLSIRFRVLIRVLLHSYGGFLYSRWRFFLPLENLRSCGGFGSRFGDHPVLIRMAATGLAGNHV